MDGNWIWLDSAKMVLKSRYHGKSVANAPSETLSHDGRVRVPFQTPLILPFSRTGRRNRMRCRCEL